MKWTKKELLVAVEAAGERRPAKEWAEKSGWSATACQRVLRKFYGPGREVPPVYEGSVSWRLLLAAVSEPGEWTPRAVAQDYGAATGEEIREYRVRARVLQDKGLLREPKAERREWKLYPTKKAIDFWREQNAPRD